MFAPVLAALEGVVWLAAAPPLAGADRGAVGEGALGMASSFADPSQNDPGQPGWTLSGRWTMAVLVLGWAD